MRRGAVCVLDDSLVRGSRGSWLRVARCFLNFVYLCGACMCGGTAD